MRLFTLEIKRILTSRRTMILLITALVLGIVMAILPILYEGINRPNDDGSYTELNGIDAIQYKRPLYEALSGEVTADMVADALIKYQHIMTEYDVDNGGKIPLEIQVNELVAIRPLIRGLTEIYANPLTGEAAGYMEIDPEDVRANYYDKCTERLNAVMQMEQKDYPFAQRNAVGAYEKVSKPFYYISGMSRDAFDYTQIYIFFLVVICTAIAAPIFSGEYQNGSDSILRCTRLGRNHLAITRLLACNTVFILTYLLGMIMHLLVLDVAFGTNCLQNSFQMIFSITSLPDLNLGQTQIIIASAGLLIMVACVSLTLFLSAKCKDSLTVILIAMVILLLPSFIDLVFAENWISSGLLPSSGIGLQNNFLYQMADFNYLHLGSMSFWTPYVIVLLAAIEIPIFIVLAIRAYNKHQVS